jgi:hypothetical protein
MTMKNAAIFEGKQSRYRHTFTAFLMQQNPQAVFAGLWILEKDKDLGG